MPFFVDLDRSCDTHLLSLVDNEREQVAANGVSFVWPESSSSVVDSAISFINAGKSAVVMVTIRSLRRVDGRA
jgi:hypothetical protein